jgi:hypothetical protein
MVGIMGRQIGSANREAKSPNAPKGKQHGAREKRQVGSKPDVFTNPDKRFERWLRFDHSGRFSLCIVNNGREVALRDVSG